MANNSMITWTYGNLSQYLNYFMDPWGFKMGQINTYTPYMVWVLPFSPGHFYSLDITASYRGFTDTKTITAIGPE